MDYNGREVIEYIFLEATHALGHMMYGTLFSWLHIYYARLALVRFEHSVCVWERERERGRGLFKYLAIAAYCLTIVKQYATQR